MNFTLRPKEPTTFNGSVDQDIDTWLGQVRDYMHLMNATNELGVTYMATLFSRVARDWWERCLWSMGNARPNTIEQLATALQERFGSSL